MKIKILKIGYDGGFIRVNFEFEGIKDYVVVDNEKEMHVKIKNKIALYKELDKLKELENKEIEL